MSRILLTWELGLNLGHLTRLLPVAQRLEAEGHVVLVAMRDIQAAARVLGPAGMPFVQAPYLPNGIPLSHRPSGYADILLSQGWSDAPTLQGLTQAWINLFRLFRPDRLLLDYSPTVSLAARIAQLPTVLVGNGFELPPATDPMPAFPGFSWATQDRAAESEGIAVANANRVLSAFSAKPVRSLSELFEGQAALLATLPELDHYGERTSARYIGPLLGRILAPRLEWPRGRGPKIFACLRPDTRQTQSILGVLSEIEARVICVASVFPRAKLEPFKKSPIHFVSGPVDLDALRDAQLCITYGAEGTMMRFLSAGVPQLVSRWHVETYMAARRIEALGAGASFAEGADKASIKELILRLCRDAEVHAMAMRVAARLAEFDAVEAIAGVVRDERSGDGAAAESNCELFASARAPVNEEAHAL